MLKVGLLVAAIPYIDSLTALEVETYLFSEEDVERKQTLYPQAVMFK